jgi:hypothetical protein
MSKTNFIERVMSFIKNDDDNKIRKFQKRAVQKLNLTVQTETAELDGLKMEKVDIETAIEEVIIDINIDKLSNTESIDSYIKEYVRKYSHLKSKLRNIEEDIEIKELKINEYKNLIEKIND